jgi:O-antigen/teichoic acid export membrane protein
VSALSRVFSGGMATGARLAVTLCTQLLLVPFYLRYWTLEDYGVWLAVQAVVGLLAVPDCAYQNYLQGEFYRLGGGEKERGHMRQLFWSAHAVGVFVSSLIGLGLLLGALLAPGDLIALVGGNSEAHAGVEWVLVAFWFFWIAQSVYGGIAVRVLAVYGRFPRTAWWGLGVLVFSTLAPLPLVAAGKGVVTALGWWVGSLAVINTVFVVDLVREMRRLNLPWVRPDWIQGGRALLRAQVLTVRGLADNLRQQGVRVLLAPLAGAAEVASFSTLRTGANVAMQGLGTVMNPLTPELMRYAGSRDRARTRDTFLLVWLVMLLAMVPTVILAQAFLPLVFPLWTQGKAHFDAPLFALLSGAVLVFGAVQPASALVAGNNLLKAQLGSALLAGAVAVGGIIVLTPHWGLRGAAGALLVAEICSAVWLERAAVRWMREVGLEWPREAAWKVKLALLGTFGVLAAMALDPTRTYLWGVAGFVAGALALGWGGHEFKQALQLAWSRVRERRR